MFESVNIFLLLLVGMTMLFPFLNMAAKSCSSDVAINTGKVLFWPVEFQTGTFRYVMRQSQFWNSFRVSLFVTVVGTALAMVATCLTAYPLSKT